MAASPRLKGRKPPTVRIALPETRAAVEWLPIIERPSSLNGEKQRVRNAYAVALGLLTGTIMSVLIAAFFELAWRDRVSADIQNWIPTASDPSLAQERSSQMIFLVFGVVCIVCWLIALTVALYMRRRLNAKLERAYQAVEDRDIITVPWLTILAFLARANRLGLPLTDPDRCPAEVLADYFAPRFAKVKALLPNEAHLRDSGHLLDPTRRRDLRQTLVGEGQETAEEAYALALPQLTAEKQAADEAKREAALTANLMADALVKQTNNLSLREARLQTAREV